MRLEKAIEVGINEGFTTVGECLGNILTNSDRYFDYNKVIWEVDELMEDFRRSKKNLRDWVCCEHGYTDSDMCPDCCH